MSHFGWDYKSVTGPVRLMVLVPWLFVTFGATIWIWLATCGFALAESIGCATPLFIRVDEWAVVIVTMFPFSDVTMQLPFVCSDFTKISKLKAIIRYVSVKRPSDPGRYNSL